MDTGLRRDRVAAARVARLATVDLTGMPHLVPICFVLIGEHVYHAVDHKPKRTPHLRRIANLEATGRASLLVDEYDEDWARLWWVRLDGTGRVLPPDPESDAALDALVAKYPQYRLARPAGPVLALDIATWRAWPP